MRTEAADAIVAKLGDMAQGLEAKIIKVVAKTAADIALNASRQVPVRTGSLRDSIRVEREEDDSPLSQLVKAGGTYDPRVGAVDYAAYVNFGTSKMPARPFLTAPAEEARAKFLTEIWRAINGGLTD